LATVPGSALALELELFSNFSGSANVTDSEGGGTTANNGAGLGSTQVSQFDASQGVLTGVAVSVESSNRVQSIVVNATDGPNNGTNHQVTATGTGASTATLAMPGLNQGFVQITSAASCTGARLGACQGSTVTTSTATNLAAQSIAAANLDSYVGSGNVSAIRTASATARSPTAMCPDEIGSRSCCTQSAKCLTSPR
jgi:hypothetical protein